MSRSQRFGRICAAAIITIGAIGLGLGLTLYPKAWPLILHTSMIVVGARCLLRGWTL